MPNCLIAPDRSHIRQKRCNSPRIFCFSSNRRVHECSDLSDMPDIHDIEVYYEESSISPLVV